MKKRLQNKIASSQIALPLTGICALAVCYFWGMLNADGYVQVACLALSTYVMAEMNNRNALLRIPSRMVSCSFLVLSMLTCENLKDLSTSLVQMLFILSLAILFTAYQDRKAHGKLFCAFSCIGLASVFWLHILLLVPVLWFCAAAFLLELSWKNFFASVLGLLLPYWLLAAWFSLHGNLDWFAVHFNGFSQWTMPELAWNGTWVELAVTLFIILLLLTGTIHFLRRSYLDKLRTRFLYEMFIVTGMALTLMIALLHDHRSVLIHLLIVCTAPLIAHFIALTNTRLTNMAFIGILVVSVGLIFFTFNPTILPL